MAEKEVATVKLTVEISGELNEALERFTKRQKLTQTDVVSWALRRLISPPEGPNG